jgi:hypothetical protein
LAEAKFVRAYNYFRLVRAFGDVVLRLHLPKDASEYNQPRTDKATVYAAIEQDLTDAAAYCRKPTALRTLAVLPKALHWHYTQKWPCTKRNGPMY